jgi:lipopolysaccharide transport system ATP-binding protein
MSLRKHSAALIAPEATAPSSGPATKGDTVIQVENLSKKYLVGHKTAHHDSFREAIVRHAGNFSRKAIDVVRGRQVVQGDTVEEFWALRDVSFEVRRGEVLGVIGRNGAGKTTLLKILSRITEPTEGRIRIKGRVASLLEVGTGFHPELTGRENIFLNGAILGMPRRQIKAKFDEIVDFAEVERFLDTPVKRYSSGMHMRLAFAVAAHLEPEILVIDEVLAVGDVVFQKKCLGKMQKTADSGRTVLFVSHNMQTVAGLTERSILLENGKATAVGPTREVIHKYLADHTTTAIIYRKEPSGTHPEFTNVRLRPSGPGALQRHGAPIAVDIEIFTPEPIQKAAVSFQILTMMHQPVLHVLTLDSELPMLRVPGRHRLTCTLPKLRLFPGHYYLSFYFGATDPRREFEAPQEICQFEVAVLDNVRDFYWAPDTALYVEESRWSISPASEIPWPDSRISGSGRAG